MFSFFFNILIMLSVLTAQIQVPLRDIFFSPNNSTQSTNYSVALFELQRVSVIQCAALCFCNTCCKEFIYNSKSRQCIGLHFPDFDSNSNLMTIPIYEGNVTRQKGIVQRHFVFLNSLFTWIIGNTLYVKV